MIFSELLTLKELKEEPFFRENMLWDIEPHKIMSPRCIKEGDRISYREKIKGYIPYIDITGKKPILFIMRHTAMDFGETIARIDEIPEEMLNEAINENRDKICFGMCPINEKIKQWLKKELGAL
ncbi:MAG: DVU0772 family protein [Thermodesulfovibrio sp.]